MQKILFNGSDECIDPLHQKKKAFHEAVEDYLNTCKQLKKEPNKTYNGTFNVRITSDLHKQAAVIAAQNNISLNDFVKTAVNYALIHQNDFGKSLTAGQQPFRLLFLPVTDAEHPSCNCTSSQIRS